MLSISTQLAPEDDLPTFSAMLKSVNFADEIVIYAMGDTQANIRSLISGNVRIIPVPTPKIVEEIRARQVREAQGDWVLIMDYDEIIPPALQAEILALTQPVKPTEKGAFALRRRNFSLGYPLSHGGWGDDYVIRLFRKSAFRTWPTNIHSTPTFQGELGKLPQPMEHHKDASLSQMVIKTNRYSAVEARQFFEGGLPPVTVFTLLRKPIMEFCRRYFCKLGFFDGAIGLLQSLYQSYSVFLSYAKLYELQHKHIDNK